jgi:hypothetical protein
MKRQVLKMVTATAGAAVGLLLVARARQRASDSSLMPVNDDRAAELIRRFAPSLDEIAREATRETREADCHDLV